MENEQQEFDIKELYTPIDVARAELEKRWNDEVLRKKVEDFLGTEMPECFKGTPKTALFRFVKTPNLEFQLANDISCSIGMDLVFFEFLNDKFCTRNQDKMHLAKMVFFHEKNGEAAAVKDRKTIIDIEANEGRRFKEIITREGGGFVDFHHKLFDMNYPSVNSFDISCLKTNGESPYEVYLKIFSLFVANGIYFENFFVKSDNDEKRFVMETIVPAFRKVEEIFGVRPLIVPLVSGSVDGCKFWQYYPDNILSQINNG